MELGFLLVHNCGNLLPAIWVEGLPERSFWRLAKIRGKTKRRVDSYRGLDCGFLEIYAADEWMGWPDK